MDNLRGIAFMVLAMAAFAVEDALIKALSVTLPTSQILLGLGMAGTAIFWALARRRGIAVFTADLKSRPIMVRNIAEMFGGLFFVTALSLIPLATAGAIIQATPLIMTLGASVLLKEAVGWRRWTAILVGFFGVLMILRPGFDAFDPNALFALAGVTMLAVRDLAARYVPARISNLQLSVYGFAASIPAGLLLLPFGAPLQMLDAPQAFLLASTVCLGVIGYYTVTLAVRTGEVSVVTPFRYSRLLFALGIGITIFAERPDMWTLLGAGLVMISGLYTLIREARLRRRMRNS